MRKASLAALLSLLLLACFFCLAVLLENGETRQAEQWVVAEEDLPPARGVNISSADPDVIAGAMGGLVPLPIGLLGASVSDGSWHGHTARVLKAEGSGVTVLGVRPVSAAPLIRPALRSPFAPDEALLGFPVMRADDGEYSYRCLLTDEAAFVIRRPLSAPPEAPGSPDSLALFGG